jgi:hypothetical protein
VIADLPDNSTAAALGIAVSAAGLVRTRTTALLTVEETDRALEKTVNYRAPGRWEARRWLQSEGWHPTAASVARSPRPLPTDLTAAHALIIRLTDYPDLR